MCIKFIVAPSKGCFTWSCSSEDFAILIFMALVMCFIIKWCLMMYDFSWTMWPTKTSFWEGNYEPVTHRIGCLTSPKTTQFNSLLLHPFFFTKCEADTSARQIKTTQTIEPGIPCPIMCNSLFWDNLVIKNTFLKLMKPWIHAKIIPHHVHIGDHLTYFFWNYVSNGTCLSYI